MSVAYPMTIADRDQCVDCLKGFLIILVVLGHSGHRRIHDVVFLFHMPLFFVISGYLLRKITLNKVLVSIKAHSIPYFFYLIIDMFFIRQMPLNRQNLLDAFGGGLHVIGVYWYITAYLFSLLLLYLNDCYIPQKYSAFSVFLVGTIAVLESNLIFIYRMREGDGLLKRAFHMLDYPGVPWKLDASLLAVVYLAIGYYCKKPIQKILHKKSRQFDLFAMIIACVLAVFCYFNTQTVPPRFNFDMKYTCYRELVLSVMLPCAFGFVIARALLLLSQLRLAFPIMEGLSFLGRITLPIMYMHMPLNRLFRSFGTGLLHYALVGLGGSVLVTVVFSYFGVMRKLLGLPDIWNRRALQSK